MRRIVLIAVCMLVVISIYGQKKKSTKKVVKSYTIEQALEYVKDYFSFYEADTQYDNPEARKISNNVFHIRVDICESGRNCYKTEYYPSFSGEKRVQLPPRTEKNEFWWRSQLYILTIGTGGKYSMKRKEDYELDY